ncbi:MAG TPA: ribonuclease P protein component [Pirellulales bacterium]|jgi:ribonuclease P protein component
MNTIDAMPEAGLPPEYRLRFKADFDRVYAGRQSVADGVLRMVALPGECPHARLGLSVSRRVGNAVRRNRFKRLLREAFRLSRAELPPLDLIVIPIGRGTPQLEPLQASIRQLSRRLAKRLARRDRREG